MEPELAPYKILDGARERRFGIVASSLKDLTRKASEKLGLTGGVKVILEQDGTEVDEEEYFFTLEKNTSLMVIPIDQKWVPPGRISFQCKPMDEVDGGIELKRLLNRLNNDIGHVSLLGGTDLELLSDMDPDSLTDIVPDSEMSRTFLEQLKEASGRFLNDKRQAQDALDLLKLYHHHSSHSLKPDPKKGTIAQ